MLARFVIPLAAAAVATSPVLANSILVAAPAPTFRDFEFGASGADQLDAARTTFAKAIPIGSSISGARQVLTKAGARCRDAQAELRCTSNHFEAVADILHDVAWTVAIDHDGNSVTGLAVDRESIGS